MALSLYFEGTSGYRLADHGVDVGRLVGNTLTFGGFSTEHEAELAADAGYVALLQWLAYRQGGPRKELAAVHVAVSEDGNLGVDRTGR